MAVAVALPEKKSFRVSTGLKDLIGRDLITDDFVAVFELVKNAFDAHATSVRLTFEEDRIIIGDNGKGMSDNDILNKWLVVAYSAKKEGTEDDDYREHIGERSRAYAGAKGVGRFSCDRLGSSLVLTSKASSASAQVVEVDWTLFEVNPKEEFTNIHVETSSLARLPATKQSLDGETGTVLEIRNLRSEWNRPKLQSLKRELTKLIDPFSGASRTFLIEIVALAELEADERDAEYNKENAGKKPERLLVNGIIGNAIMDAIGERTTAIQIALSNDGKTITTTLEDRGKLIYKIREENPYAGLAETCIHVDIYYLNRSAKVVFANRMGLPSVQFGSIFLFRNGFRVFPIGAPDDDFFLLNQRKQQGVRRFLGGRDLIGRVEIKGVSGFDEATSRNQGLIETPQVRELIEFIKEKCVKRLERYVVDISWMDKFDQEVDDTSRIMMDENSAKVTKLISRLAATSGVELVEYNPEIVRIIEDISDEFEGSLKALELLAEETGNSTLLSQVDAAKARIYALRIAEAEAREAQRRAEERAVLAEASRAAAVEQLTDERKRNDFLVAASSLDEDTILNLHHQIIIHAADVQNGVERMMVRLRADGEIAKEDWVDFLESTSYRNSQILTAARFATKGGYREQSTLIEADLALYISDYIETISTLWAPQGMSVHVASDAREFTKKFKPIEVGIVLDNFISNSKKANASNVGFEISVSKGAKAELMVAVADDGLGWPNIRPLERLFEKGVTSTDGSGLGLHHIRRVIGSLKGVVELHEEAYSAELDGANILVRIAQ
ncbi:hypothetical protein MMA231_01251 [Asticcacaulis sp. MM231]|uniref:ATP-binding protein n=1 Tax=Asticcacaulis sp. MM231 TaxID=3157666 RepID=UPI0032D58162